MTEFGSDAFDTFRFMPEATFKLMQSRIEKLNEIEKRNSTAKDNEMQGTGDLPSRPPEFITPGTLSATGVPSTASAQMSHSAYEDPNAEPEQEEERLQQPSDAKGKVTHKKRQSSDRDEEKKPPFKKDKQEEEEEEEETGGQPRPPYYLGKGPFHWTV